MTLEEKIIGVVDHFIMVGSKYGDIKENESLLIEMITSICQEAIDERLDKIIGFAFREGENWGVTYSTWFTPDRKKQKAKLKSVILATREKFNLPLPELKENT